MENGIELRLTLAPGGGSLSGVLEHGGESVEFSGWIELVALIEARRTEGDGSRARQPDPTRVTPTVRGRPEAPPES